MPKKQIDWVIVFVGIGLIIAGIALSILWAIHMSKGGSRR